MGDAENSKTHGSRRADASGRGRVHNHVTGSQTRLATLLAYFGRRSRLLSPSSCRESRAFKDAPLIVCRKRVSDRTWQLDLVTVLLWLHVRWHLQTHVGPDLLSHIPSTYTPLLMLERTSHSTPRQPPPTKIHAGHLSRCSSAREVSGSQWRKGGGRLFKRCASLDLQCSNLSSIF